MPKSISKHGTTDSVPFSKFYSLFAYKSVNFDKDKHERQTDQKKNA